MTRSHAARVQCSNVTGVVLQPPASAESAAAQEAPRAQRPWVHQAGCRDRSAGWHAHSCRYKACFMTALGWVAQIAELPASSPPPPEPRGRAATGIVVLLSRVPSPQLPPWRTSRPIRRSTCRTCMKRSTKRVGGHAHRPAGRPGGMRPPRRTAAHAGARSGAPKLLRRPQALTSTACGCCCRAEAMPVRHVLPVRQDHRHRRPEDAPLERAGLGGVRGRSRSHERAALHAGLPLLREADRECPGDGCDGSMALDARGGARAQQAASSAGARSRHPAALVQS
jgi:hypothetical protein